MSTAVAMTHRLDVTAGLIRSTALIQDIYAAASAEHGLTRQQAQLMCVVGDRPSSMVRVGALLRIGKSSMTGLVHRAEGAGLIHRVPDPDDGRSSLIALTPEGRRANDAFRRALSERIEEIIATLSAEERDSLASVLSKVVLDNEAPETWPAE
jgi:DNA-binding MarR family transcriptional regulator